MHSKTQLSSSSSVSKQIQRLAKAQNLRKIVGDFSFWLSHLLCSSLV